MKRKKQMPGTLLFPPSEDPIATSKTVKWRLATNQRNLLYMLAAGMVMSPQGFGKKYYRDTLSSYPGWIPLFANNVPQTALDLSVSERAHLTPAIVTMELKSLRGRLWAVDIDGRAREIQFPSELNGNEAVLLVPAPLPVNWIESIAFSSREIKAGCESDARDFGNVPLLDFQREIDARLFSGAIDLAWPPHGVTLPDRDHSPDKAIAAGGMMAMLLHMGNYGDVGTQMCRLGFTFDARDALAVSDPMLRELATWMQTDSAFDSADVLPKLFWGAVDSVSRSRTASDTKNPIDAVLEYLNSAGEGLDDKMKQALSKLSGDLSKLTGFADRTITELFERNPKPFTRVMTLFVLRNNSSQLMEFRHPLLTDVDYVAAAIMFAARDGWLGLPLILREVDGLQAAVSHRMTAIDHRLSATGLEFGDPPMRPLPLRELLSPGPKGWSPKQREAALLLASEAKWMECIYTRINLGKGEYRMIIDGGGVQILLPGEVKAVVTEVNPAQLFSQLRSAEIPVKIEKKIRSILKT